MVVFAMVAVVIVVTGGGVVVWTTVAVDFVVVTVWVTVLP